MARPNKIISRSKKWRPNASRRARHTLSGVAEVPGGSRVSEPGQVASVVADRLGWAPEAIADEKYGDGRAWVAYQRAKHAPEGAYVVA